MQRYVLRLGGLLVLPALLCLAMPGCGAMGNSLPADVTVTLPDGTTETVTLGAGVDSLADTESDRRGDLRGDHPVRRGAT